MRSLARALSLSLVSSSFFVCEMFRVLIEGASLKDHVYVLRTCLLERMELATARLQDRREVIDTHGRILFDDRLLGPYFPLVSTVVHMSERTRIDYDVRADLPLKVDIVGWVRKVYLIGVRLQLRGGRNDAQAVRVMRMVQWLLLVWVRMDPGVMRAAFGDGGPPRAWWALATMLHRAWRVEGRVMWTATPTTRAVVIEARRWKSTTLMGLLAQRYCLMCC